MIEKGSTMFKRSLLLILGLIGAQANAGTQTWDFDAATFGGSGNNNYLTMVVDGITLTITGWSDAGAMGGDLRRSAVKRYTGGLGVQNGRDGDHSTDNSAGMDGLMFSFSSAVSLDWFRIGWFSNDSDMSVAAYSGGGAPTTLSNLRWNELLSDGWVQRFSC